MARKVTIKAFEAWIADEANVLDVLERISGGLTLQKTSRVVKQPFTCLYEYFHSTPEMEARYNAARKAWVAAKKDEAFEIAETVAPDRDHVAKAKLQIDVIDNQARAYDRERWGERVQVDKSVTVRADAALLDAAGDLLRLVRRPRVVEGVALERDGETVSATLALPPARAVGD